MSKAEVPYEYEYECGGLTRKVRSVADCLLVGPRARPEKGEAAFVVALVLVDGLLRPAGHNDAKDAVHDTRTEAYTADVGGILVNPHGVSRAEHGVQLYTWERSQSVAANNLARARAANAEAASAAGATRAASGSHHPALRSWTLKMKCGSVLHPPAGDGQPRRTETALFPRLQCDDPGGGDTLEVASVHLACLARGGRWLVTLEQSRVFVRRLHMPGLPGEGTAEPHQHFALPSPVPYKLGDDVYDLFEVPPAARPEHAHAGADPAVVTVFARGHATHQALTLYPEEGEGADFGEYRPAPDRRGNANRSHDTLSEAAASASRSIGFRVRIQGRELAKRRGPRSLDADRVMTAACAGPQPGMVLAGFATGGVELLDVVGEPGRCLWSLSVPDAAGAVKCLAVAPGAANNVAVAGFTSGRTVTVLQDEGASAHDHYPAHAAGVKHVLLHTPATSLSVAAANVRMWDARSSEPAP